MAGHGHAHAQVAEFDDARSHPDGELHLMGVQLGHAQRHTGHVLLGPVGGQVWQESHRIPDHGAIPVHLDYIAHRENGNGADGVQVPRWAGRQRRGHQQSHVRGRGERHEHAGLFGLAVHTHVQRRCAVRVRIRRVRWLRLPERGLSGRQRAVHVGVVLHAGVAGIPDQQGPNG